ncbi:hypothetical protein [Micromonospora chokoriensis]|uniref:hypothetical protein n=1 Tax=Micromonospora chokoriensis TaxID=356851 RepID=UPI001E35AE55|nr:hypothetical protein [Micromonospora chokoriensis]
MLEERPVPFEGLTQVRGLVRRAQPAPADQVGARRDGRRRVDLQQRQVPHHSEQVGRARGGQQLGPHGDPSCLRAIELVHTHAGEPNAAHRHAADQRSRIPARRQRD